LAQAIAVWAQRNGVCGFRCCMAASARRRRRKRTPATGRVVILAGPPGATETRLQHDRIVQAYGYVPISVGTLLSEHLRYATELGTGAEEHAYRQKHLPSEFVVSLLRDRLSKPDVRQQGCLLDGFPLSKEDADAMKGQIDVDQFLVIEVPDETIIDRCALNPTTGTIYNGLKHPHLNLAPPMEQSDQIEDNTDDKVRTRLEAYHASIIEVLLRFRGKVRIIDGTQDNDATFSAISDYLGVVPSPVLHAKKGPVVVVAGPPGTGRKTQCERIVKELGFVHICASSLLTKHIKRCTTWGTKARVYTDRRECVPSELLVGLLKDRVSKPDAIRRGCLLDGFPLSGEHAEAMKGHIEIDHFLVLNVPNEILIESFMNRCLNLKFRPDSLEASNNLVQSDDDKEQARMCLMAYQTSLDAILPHVHGMVQNIDGTQHPDAVFSTIVTCLGRVATPAPIVINETCPVVVISVPPSAWKKDQTNCIAKKLGLVPISAASLLLDHMRCGDELGAKAKECIDKQERVPSELIVSLIRDRMCKPDVLQRGCLLGDFPLSLNHTKAMKGQIEIDYFVVIELPDETLIERSVNKRLGSETGVIEPKTKRASSEAVSRSAQTADDIAKMIRAQLEAYHAALGDILPHFEGKIRKVNGMQRLDAVSNSIRSAISRPEGEPVRQKAARRRPQTHHPIRSTANRMIANLHHSFSGRMQCRQLRSGRPTPRKAGCSESQQLLSEALRCEVAIAV